MNLVVSLYCWIELGELVGSLYCWIEMYELVGSLHCLVGLGELELEVRRHFMVKMGVIILWLGGESHGTCVFRETIAGQIDRPGPRSRPV